MQVKGAERQLTIADPLSNYPSHGTSITTCPFGCHSKLFVSVYQNTSTIYTAAGLMGSHGSPSIDVRLGGLVVDGVTRGVRER